MPFSPETFAEKPYNKCITCEHLGVRCDGPNFLAMSIERWCEWCRLRKLYLNVSSAEIADRAGVSKISVDRVMSGNCGDVRVSTMQLITKALVNGSWGQYPCASPEPEIIYRDNPEMVQQLMNLHQERERLYDISERREAAHKAALQEATDKAERDAQRRVNYLKGIIRVLSVICVVLLVVVIAALVIDATTPNLGYFWNMTAEYFAGNGADLNAIRFLRG